MKRRKKPVTHTDRCLGGLGFFESVKIIPRGKGAIVQKFVIPPFSVLNAREGFWQNRKRAWIELGIKGEEGRTEAGPDFSAAASRMGYSEEISGEDKERYNESRRMRNGKGVGDVIADPALKDKDYYRHKEGKKKPRLAPGAGGGGAWLGGPGTDSTPKFKKKGKRGPGTAYNIGDKAAYDQSKLPEQQAGDVGKLRHAAAPRLRFNGQLPNQSTCSDQYNTGSGTSVFDPVLCELMYRWFAPEGGYILDPFAGESTKGLVAGALGHPYTGVELRPEQVAANRRQAKEFKVPLVATPAWVCGDSARLNKLLPEGEKYDFVWTSPPYYDLEIYSKREKDGSAFETYEKFMVWYRDIFAQAVARLRPNRFLAVKVGEIRDERGIYRNFVGDNVACFTDLGLHYYNEFILVTAVGSLPIRVPKQFEVGRKCGKTHQNVQIYWHGDPKKLKRVIKKRFGSCY